ncbi:hypothetical protein BDD12DRAFT_888717 [Trichophaea hybrida]|nr:hypothetical protein BDD12DRAFT_888717 [Trichophaea hybrida]
MPLQCGSAAFSRQGEILASRTDIDYTLHNLVATLSLDGDYLRIAGIGHQIDRDHSKQANIADCDSNFSRLKVLHPETTSTLHPLTPFRDDPDMHRAFICSSTAFSKPVPMNHDASNNPRNATYNGWAPRDDSAHVKADRREWAPQDHLQQQLQQQAASKYNSNRKPIYLCDAMNVVDESNLLPGGCGYNHGNTGPGTAATFTPGPMDLGSIRQSNACARCSGKGQWSYFCATPKDSMEGDPIKKPDFNKAKRRRREQEKGEKGHRRCAHNHTTEAEAVTVKGAAGDRGKNGGCGNINVSQAGNA